MPRPSAGCCQSIGVLAPNSPLRSAVTAQAEPATICYGAPADPAPPKPVLPKSFPAHYLWSVLIVSPARGPLLWEVCDAQVGEGTQVVPDWDLATQPAPDYGVDWRVN